MNQLYWIAFRAMGCRVEVQLETDEDGNALLQPLPAQFESLEAQLSRFRPESDLMQLNAQAGQWTPVSDVLYENVAAAKHGARLTDGLYNPLVLPALIASGYDRSFDSIGAVQSAPAARVEHWQDIHLRPRNHEVLLPARSALDLGGIAKGWAAEKVARQLAAHGPCLINVGGDIALRGAPFGAPGWRVSIGDPDGAGALCEVVLHDHAVVTSGVDYRRWQTVDGQPRHHLIDPRTGKPAATDVRSVTIVHRHAPTAEAYAKAVLLLGSRPGLDWLNQQWGAAGMLVSSDGAVFATSNWLTLMERSFT